MRCLASSAITPAVTLDNTASMKARRVSSWVFALRSSVVCSSSRSVIWLKAVASVWTSSSLFEIGNSSREIARLDPPGCVHKLTDGPYEAVREIQSRHNG